jgi:hypothetical protein
MKKVAKGFLLFIGSTTYIWLLFLSAGAFELRQTFAQPHTVKNWLANSGVYGGIVEEVSKLATIQQKQENSLVQITSDDITGVAKDSFPVSSIKNDSENVIDGFYGWLKGNTSSPEFSVDFTSRQAAFAREMTDKLAVKINALPACSTTGRYSIQAFDPFKADCKPKGADVTAGLSSFEKDLAVSKDILPQMVYSQKDIKLKDSQGQQVGIATAFSWAPEAYKGLLWGPWLIALLTILAALSLIFLSSSRRKGLYRVAGGLLFVGVIMLVSGFLLRPAFDKLNILSSKSIGAEASFTEHIINPLFSQMNSTYSKYNIIIGIAYLIPALCTYGALMLTKSKEHVDEIDEQAYEGQYRHADHAEEPIHLFQKPEMADSAQSDVAVPVVASTQSIVLPPQHQPVQPVARPIQRPVTRRPPMIQG